jgi:3-dehydro-4-phosphotetronate decarboxylase
LESVNELRKQLQEAGRYMLANGLTWGNAGNLSARIDEGRYLITASGTRLGDLADEDLPEVRLDPARGPAPAAKPSKELPMHGAVYRQRPEINAVLHTSSFYATLVACSDLDLPADWFVEDMYYLERVARVPYRHPGSAELGEVVAATARAANVLLLENHGVLVYDASVSEMLMGVHAVELVSKMMIIGRSANVEMRPIPPDMVTGFLEKSGYRPRRKWPTGAED